ncbi:hypothetical protein L7826_11100 [Staphylococcus epidermidis]|uniref:hypothetical protein n=1 Tax=Staphylococcus epidermidis TaxID=1282 RepID=UPI00266B8334|nr:hypothetical protein [Staphylococcus epidermidis]MDO2946540.1 hypothetical protein [Staphylococcus epidermidis]
MDINKIENYLDTHRRKVLNKCSNILNRDVTIQSFNGIFGGKNHFYRVVPESYSTANDYIKAWFDSFEQKYQSEKYKVGDISSHRMKRLLEDEDIKNYVIIYLARTYLRKSNK